MNRRGVTAALSALSFVVATAACNRDTTPAATRTDDATVRDADRTADLQQQRTEDISRLDERVATVEREYAAANQKVASGARTATPGLREELKEDVANAREAVSDLRSTTPENWWERHE